MVLVQKYEIVGESEAVLKAKDFALKAAKTNFTILILGERGTGKELFVQLIRENSSRADKPFIAVNCAAIPESLMESELFGIEEKTASGVKGRAGIFESAIGGTVFFDEIGDMPIAAQAKFLRPLQEKEVTRVGGRESIPTDVRIIAATNKMEEIYKDSIFRADLLDRLNGLTLVLPPLRERDGDIIVLFKHFLNKCGTTPLITGSARKLLECYSWPGNVRELEKLSEKVIVQAGDKSKLTAKDLLKICPELNRGQDDSFNTIEKTSDTDVPKAHNLRRKILDYLSQNGAAGRVCICAELNISPTTFKRYIGELCAVKEVVPTGNGKATRYQVAGPDRHPKGATQTPNLGDLDSRQEALEKYLESSGHVSRSEYQSLTGVSSATACRDLQAMIESGFILKKGVGRAVKYLLKSVGQSVGEGA